MSKKHILLIVLISISLDQITKFIVEENTNILKNGLQITSFFNLVYVENRGVSFGMFAEHDKSFYFGILSVLISLYIIYLILNSKKFLELLGLSLILGGALGNGLDRIFYGYVVDFIDFHLNHYHWRAFNVADTSITLGAIAFVSSLIFEK